MKTSRSRATSRSRWRRRPALPSSRRSRAGQGGGLRRVGAAARMVRASARASPPSGSSANAAGGRVEVVEQVRSGCRSADGAHTASLLGAGQHPDRLGQLGVGGQAGARQHRCAQCWPTAPRRWHRIWPRHRIPGSIPRGGQRVDRIDHPAGGAQRGHPQSVIGFDPHRDRVLGGVAGLGQQRQQLREAGRVVADPSAPPHACRRRPQRHRDVLWPNQFHNTGARYHHSFDRCVEHEPRRGHAGALIAGLNGPSSH